MGKPLGHGPIYDWSCEPQSLALKPASQEGNNVTSNEICYKRCHEHTTCQECLDSSGGAEGGEREKTFVIYFDSVRSNYMKIRRILKPDFTLNKTLEINALLFFWRNLSP